MIRQEVRDFARAHGAADPNAVALAVSEAVTNAIVHAYVDAPEPGEIEVIAQRIGDDCLEILVCDDGRGMLPATTARASASGCRSSRRSPRASRCRRAPAAAPRSGWRSRRPRTTDGRPETRTTRAPVVSAREALEFLSRAGFVLADSLDYEQTLARVVDLVVPQIADWCGVYIADGDGTAREITSRHADPDLERMLVEIRRRRREQQDGSETLQVLRSGRSILATDVTRHRRARPDESQRQTSSGSARARTSSSRSARAAA